MQSADAAVVRQSLAELPDIHRNVIELAYFEGLNYREVAERMEIPLGTVKSRMRHGLEKLASAVAKHEPELRESPQLKRAAFNAR